MYKLEYHFKRVLMSLGGISTYGVRGSNVESVSLKSRNYSVTEEVRLDDSKELCGRGGMCVYVQMSNFLRVKVGSEAAGTSTNRNFGPFCFHPLQLLRRPCPNCGINPSFVYMLSAKFNLW